MTDVLDSTATELPADDQQVDDDIVPATAPAPTTLARRERRSEVIRPLNANDLVESFKAYQDLLPQLLNSADYQGAGRGKRFVKKSGWRKIATAFDLDVQIIRSQVERDHDGNPRRAEVWARAIAPSGRSMDGDGYCSFDEDRFSGPRGNQSKLENDLRATATTRAMNRAISGLVGMGEVSAEEVDGSGGQHDTGPPHGPAVTDMERIAASAALTQLVGDTELARERWGQIKQACGGYMPHAVAAALLVLAPQSPDTEPEILAERVERAA
jgi:hypothetical protein